MSPPFVIIPLLAMLKHGVETNELADILRNSEQKMNFEFK